MGWEQQVGWRRPRRFFICRSDRGPVDKQDKNTARQSLSGEWKMGGGKGGLETCWGGQGTKKGISLLSSFKSELLSPVGGFGMSSQTTDKSHRRESRHQLCCVLAASG